jgi:pilus assembly protein CpaE
VAVEAPVVVAIVVALTLLCLQMVVWGASHVFARHAALEGARVAATTTDPRSIDAAVDGALPAGWARTAPVTLTPGDTVQVTVSTPSLLPGFDELDVTSRAAVLREPS